MSEHPIEGLMKTTMESIKEMVDVNTIVGDPVETLDGQVIIPISKVCFGFVSGGGEYSIQNKSKHRLDKDDACNTEKVPFAGGAGAGVTVQPVAFMIVGNGQMKLSPVDQGSAILNSLLDFIPKVTNSMQQKKKKTTNSCEDNIE
ncbi:sporulation protein YtfJ [Gottschalkia purinilytica]|uniref:Sporulation protein YtfJ n=1 Tax=Gottschalkia purinilytica TaxID=1503 RepID=A0A0L0W7J7_GOTPU|nr:GerW family sporulation protein [Gottschalkia purinilytica]KNF07432.1 sporulation protein YtfJ [Gottschalkia purinilytica]